MVIQYFTEEETKIFGELIKKRHFEIFPGALRHFRIYFYTTGGVRGHGDHGGGGGGCSDGRSRGDNASCRCSCVAVTVD